MIETQADARLLTSIDAATSLGQLADQVVIAVARRLDGAQPRLADEEALYAAADWLDRLGRLLERPLDISYVGATGLYGFGPYVVDAAIDAIGPIANRDSEIKLLRRLRDLTRSIASGAGKADEITQIRDVFEAIARAMLSAAGSLLNSPDRSAWLKTYAF